MDTVYKSKTIMKRSKHGTLIPVTRVVRIPQNKYTFAPREVPGSEEVTTGKSGAAVVGV